MQLPGVSSSSTARQLRMSLSVASSFTSFLCLSFGSSSFALLRFDCSIACSNVIGILNHSDLMPSSSCFFPRSPFPTCRSHGPSSAPQPSLCDAATYEAAWQTVSLHNPSKPPSFRPPFSTFLHPPLLLSPPLSLFILRLLYPTHVMSLDCGFVSSSSLFMIISASLRSSELTASQELGK